MVSNIAKKDLFKLEDHPFFVEVDKNYIPLVEKINAQLGGFEEAFKKRNVPKKINFTPHEKYRFLVFSKLIAFSNIYRNLKYSHIYISEFHSPKKLEKYGIHKFDFLTYHYTAHILSYVSILDIALILTNAVLQLGLSDEECKYKVVTSKAGIPSIQSDLDKIGAAVRRHKTTRNQFLHHGKLPNIIDINNSDVLYFLQLLKSQSKKVKQLNSDYKEGINYLYEAEAKDILDKLSTDVTEIENVISGFLNHLLAAYKIINTAYSKET